MYNRFRCMSFIRNINKSKAILMFNFCMFLVSILYTHNVVGGVVNYINDIYGARTSLFLTSQRMPGATTRTHAYIIGKHFGVEIFAVIFLLHILYAQRCWWGCKLYKRHIWRRRCYSPNPCFLI